MRTNQCVTGRTISLAVARSLHLIIFILTPRLQKPAIFKKAKTSKDSTRYGIMGLRDLQKSMSEEAVFRKTQ